jgi:putative SOS response-associated peptidase YedK
MPVFRFSKVCNVSGSFSGHKSWKEIQDLCGLSIVSGPLKKAGLQPTAVVKPGDQWPHIRAVDGTRGLDLGTWGFPPPAGRSSLVINARCETMDVLPRFVNAFEHHRCVVPVTGYYEWKKEVDGSRTPWQFSLEGKGGNLFLMAGLFMVDSKIGQNRFVTVTTDPNEMAAEIHDRMPVILTDDMTDTWLSADATPHALKRLCRPYEGANLIATPMSKNLHQPPKDVDENQFGFAL